ncbi:hypothetical protein V6N12_016038 [Hibiscus sabdariffa]|uniref:GPI mannosyltransferase 2 n=1 Tax=Hibiscus sabdariffa TaxID=183260 RepID=A0ABR1Z6D4_9ROSI
MLSIPLTFFLGFLCRLLLVVSDPWFISSICHWFCTAFLTVAGPEPVLFPWVVVFCASIETGSFMLLSPRLGIFGRRSSTVQGPGSFPSLIFVGSRLIEIGAQQFSGLLFLAGVEWLFSFLVARGGSFLGSILPRSLFFQFYLLFFCSLFTYVASFYGRWPSGGPPGRHTAEREEAVRILGPAHPPGSTQEAVGASCLPPRSLGPPGYAILIGLCGLSLLAVMHVDIGTWLLDLAQPLYEYDLLGWRFSYCWDLFYRTPSLRLWFLRALPNWVVYNSLVDRCWSWELLVPHSAGWGCPGPSTFSTGLSLLCLNWAVPGWVSFSWIVTPQSWMLSFPAWHFPTPTQLETKSRYLLLVWSFAQACWVGHVLIYDPRLHANYSYWRPQSA